jgi:hypothetical protein
MGLVNLVASAVVELDDTLPYITDVHWDIVGTSHGWPVRYRMEELR